MIKDFFLLAYRGIIKRGLRSWLTMIGIFIGIAAVVSLISLGQGMQNAITSEFSGLGSDKLTLQASGGLGIPGQGAINPITTEDAKAIAGIPGVSETIPRLLEPVKVEINDITEFRLVATAPDDPKQLETIIQNLGIRIKEGRTLKSGDENAILLTYDYYKDNNAFGKISAVGDKVLINGKKFTVVGLVDKTGNPLIDQAIVMLETPLRNLLNLKDKIDVLLVVVSDGYDPSEVAKRIEDFMRRRRDEKVGHEDFTVQTPQQLLSTVGNVITAVNIILIGIAGISLFVGGIGIMNTMYTSVLERTRDIGIMKSIGAKNSSVLLIFLMESGLLGMVGGLVGIAGGITLSKGVEFAANAAGISVLKANFNLFLIIGALMFSFVIGIISGVLPALQASRLNPVDALRKK